MRLCLILASLLSLTACGDDDFIAYDGGGGDIEAIDGGLDAPMDSTPGDGSTQNECAVLVVDEGGDSLFPNPAMMQPADTPTGVQLVVDVASFPDLARYESLAAMMTDGLSELDGFGTTAGAAFLFEGPVDVAGRGGADQDPVEAGFGFVVLPEEGTPYLAPAEAFVQDGGRGLTIRPSRPLPPATWVVAFATDALAACTLESAWLEAQLADPTPEMSAALEALASEGILETELIALNAFPTQSLFTIDEEIAATIAAQTLDDIELESQGCTFNPGDEAQRCRMILTANDYRDADGVIRGSEPTATWPITIHIWLPAPAEGFSQPYKTLFFGHGLSTGAPEMAPNFVPQAVERGYAMVATSALYHPDHPTAREDSETLDVLMDFFGIDMAARTVDALVLRDNFRQTAFDRLQVIKAISLASDLNFDGEPDLDPARFGYLGVSLGALQGVQLMALQQDIFGAATLCMPGGRLSQIISDDEASFSLLFSSLAPPTLRSWQVERVFVVLQTVIEAGDPMNWGTRVLKNRSGGAPPDVFAQMAIGDNVVPNVTTFDVARAINLPIMPPVFRESTGFALTGPAPVSANIEGTTAALQQYDVLSGGASAAHGTLGLSLLAETAYYHFFETAWEGPAEIMDPYAELGVPHRD